jgi:small-conductance mechanosensitive channel
MMFIQTWGGAFNESLIGLWSGFISFVPNLLGAIVIFIIGWVVGSVIGKAIAQLLATMKLDKLFESAGAGELMNRAGLKLNVGGFVGWLVKWFIIVIFLVASLQILGLTQVNDFLREAVLFYLPKVIISVLVLVLAAAIADTMRKLVQASVQASGSRSAVMVGSVVKYAIWIFAFIIVLSELGIAAAFMQILFTGLVAALSIALGLAFGLGGKEAASRAVDKFSNNMKM